MLIRRPLLFIIVVALLPALAACNLPAQAGRSAGASLPTATEPVPQVFGHCRNPLQPVIQGAEWTYAMSGISTGTFTRSITAVRQDGFTDRDVFDSGVTRTGEWHCENGDLTSLSPAEGFSGILQSEGMTAEFTTTESSGVTIPAIVTPGDAWSQTFAIEGTQSIAGTSVDSRGEISYTCKAAYVETVVIAGGAFDSMRVGCQMNARITATVAGVEVPTEIASATTIWYARDVGMVKTESEISGIGHSTIELTSFTVP